MRISDFDWEALSFTKLSNEEETAVRGGEDSQSQDGDPNEFE